MLQQKLTVSFLEQTNAMRSKGGLIAAKVGLFIVIMFYLVTGIALMGLGVVCQINLSVNLVLNDGWYGAPLLLSAVGFLIFMISTFGAVAVFNEHQGMIRTFTAVLAIVVLFEILAGISAFVLRDKLSKILLKKFQKIINKYGVDDDVTEGVDTLQQKFQCCGAQNSSDWTSSPFTLSSGFIPSSCCKNNQVVCNTTANENGENGEFSNLNTQSVGIICSCCLVKLLKGNYKVL
ncbi:CD63 antigen-like isoform X2 [Lissotriton helveticus]